MTLYRATVLDTVGEDLAGCELRVDEDAGIVVRGGAIVDRGAFADVAGRHPDEQVVNLGGGMLLPGMVDTHVHFPQVRVIGELGLPLLEWLDRHALPEESRFASDAYADAVAREFVRGLLQSGTTTALAFGAHQAAAVDELFTVAADEGLRLVAGLVVSDRALPAGLLCTPDEAYRRSLELASRWHGVGRMRYAVTPRFSLSASDPMLEACAALLRDIDGVYFTSHINENDQEIRAVKEMFGAATYLETYAGHGLIGRRSVLAHNVHPEDGELDLLARSGASVAHCPTSNAVLGSGLFPLRRHVEAGVRVGLGSDVGAGTGFFLPKEGLQAYMIQRLLGAEGYPLGAHHLLYLATAAGAQALDMADSIGDLGIGRQFDAVWISPAVNPVLAGCLANADSPEDALARVFALATPNDVESVWVDGVVVGGRGR